MPFGDIVDVDRVEAATGEAEYPPRQGLHDEATGRGRRRITLTKRERRIDHHDGQTMGREVQCLALAQPLGADVVVGLIPVLELGVLVGEFAGLG
jgi:hypothetical protein